MGEFNIVLNACSKSKSLNMLQFFCLTQFVQMLIKTSSTLIDHTYSSHLENITNCFVSTLSISDHDLETSVNDHEPVDADMAVFSSVIIQQLNKHASIKIKRVKTKRLSYWFTPDIRQMQKLRNNCKCKKNKGPNIKSIEIKQGS